MISTLYFQKSNVFSFSYSNMIIIQMTAIILKIFRDNLLISSHFQALCPETQARTKTASAAFHLKLYQ
jgi:hypothetical protein